MKVAFRPFSELTPVKYELITDKKYRNGKFVDVPLKTMKDAKNLIENDLYIYDTDNAHEDDHYLVIIDDNGKYHYFKLHHEFYWHGWGSDDRHVENTFTWKEITKEEAKIPADRDYLDTRSKSTRSVNWPPKNNI